MAPNVFFEAYLTLGRGQSLTCQDLYWHLRTTPTLLRTLAQMDSFPLGPPGEGIELFIDDPNSIILGRDQFFRYIVHQLKDPQLPISRMKLSGLNWFNVHNVGSWHTALISFPNVRSLFLNGVVCEEMHFLSIIRSLRALTHLQLDENKIQTYEATRSLGVENVDSRFSSIEDIRNNQRGPELISLRVGITTVSDRIALDLFATRNSPVALRHLRELIIRDYANVVCDINFARRLNALLELTTDLFDLDLDSFQITQSLPPLNIPNLHWFRFTIHVNRAYQMDKAISWWIDTLVSLPKENQLRMITVTVEVDALPNSTTFPRDVSVWTALDRAICREEIQLEELFFKICAPDTNEGHIYRWICMRCLPMSRQRYASRFTEDDPCFTLLNNHHQVVDLKDFM